MKQYKCTGCSEQCGSTASDRPTQCLFHADSKCPKWELIEQPVRNNYATVSRSYAPATDWKKAFEMLRERSLLVVLRDFDGEIKHQSIVIGKILIKCTKGGEKNG